MKSHLISKWLVMGIVATATGVFAQNAPGGATSTSDRSGPEAGAEKAQGKPAAVAAAKSSAPSAVVNEVLKMVQGGVSKDVVKAYIDTAPISAQLSAVDIIALKEHAVPDDLAVALVKRGAEVSVQTAGRVAAPATAAGPAEPVAAVGPPAATTSGYMDPEGYDYFWYYYLYPRTLASANQRLYSSYPSFAPGPYYGFGYYPPGAFRHHTYRTHFRPR